MVRKCFHDRSAASDLCAQCTTADKSRSERRRERPELSPKYFSCTHQKTRRSGAFLSSFNEVSLRCSMLSLASMSFAAHTTIDFTFTKHFSSLSPLAASRDAVEDFFFIVHKSELSARCLAQPLSLRERLVQWPR